MIKRWMKMLCARARTKQTKQPTRKTSWRTTIDELYEYKIWTKTTNTWNNRIHARGKNEQHHLKMKQEKFKYMDRITSWKSKDWLKAVAPGSKLDEYNEAIESKRTCSTVGLDTWQSSFPVYWKWFFIRFMPPFRWIFEFERWNKIERQCNRQRKDERRKWKRLNKALIIIKHRAF